MIASIGGVKTEVSRKKLTIHPDELKRMESLEYSTRGIISHCGYKVCATRHGCSGATNCDNAYSDYKR